MDLVRVGRLPKENKAQNFAAIRFHHGHVTFQSVRPVWCHTNSLFRFPPIPMLHSLFCCCCRKSEWQSARALFCFCCHENEWQMACAMRCFRFASTRTRSKWRVLALLCFCCHENMRMGCKWCVYCFVFAATKQQATYIAPHSYIAVCVVTAYCCPSGTTRISLACFHQHQSFARGTRSRTSWQGRRSPHSGNALLAVSIIGLNWTGLPNTSVISKLQHQCQAL